VPAGMEGVCNPSTWTDKDHRGTLKVDLYRSKVSGATDGDLNDLIKKGTIKLEKVKTVDLPRKAEWVSGGKSVAVPQASQRAQLSSPRKRESRCRGISIHREALLEYWISPAFPGDDGSKWSRTRHFAADRQDQGNDRNH